MAKCCLVLLGWLACSGAVLAQPVADKPSAAEASSVKVELLLRNPDGHPIANKAVVIRVVGSKPPQPPDQTVTTNSHGLAQFEVHPGYFQLAVTVAGVGYGSTAQTDFTAGEVIRPALPPLAGFGSIDGVTPHTCPDRANVSISTPLHPLQHTVADDSGHFHIADVPGGDWFLLAAKGENGREPCGIGPTVTVNVGQDLKGVTLDAVRQATSQPQAAPAQAPVPQPAPAPAPAPVKIGHPVHSDVPIVFAQGKVTDEAGQPVAEATVYALGTFSGGIRMLETVAKATTDKDGHYELKGASGQSNFSATLVATAPGHPPAWAWPAFPQISFFDPDAPAPQPVNQDLVLPSKSGQMTVTALRDGKPAPGVQVAVYLEGANLRDIWALGGMGGVREEVENAAYPAAVTDASGVAHFANLLPGRYKIYAVVSARVDDVRGMTRFPRLMNGVAGATASGIPVRLGEETRHALNIYAASNAANFTLLRQDGTAFAGNVPIEFGQTNGPHWNSSVLFNDGGVGDMDLDQSGLWQVRFIHKRDSATGGFKSPDDFRAPYDSATALAAISPNLPAPAAPVLTLRHVDPPGVDVVVQDSNGLPVRASVSIEEGSYPYQKNVGAGSTDRDGKISFAGLESGKGYAVHVSGTELAKIPQFTWHYFGTETPSPEDTRTREAFVDQPFTLDGESRQTVVVHPTPLIYVWGTIHSQVEALNTIGAWLDQQPRGFVPKLLLDTTTGEFIAGPLLPGPNLVHFRTENPEKQIAIPVDADPSTGPIRCDIDIDKYAAQADENAGLSGTPNSYLGMGGISSQSTGAQRLVGKVFLSDGVTPALGAQALYFEAGSLSPPFLAIADALGELHARGLWYAQPDQPSSAPRLQQSLLVTFLPGERGATVYNGPIHAGVPFSLTLPPAISLSGTVTVGGRSPAQGPGSIRVLAEFQDKGALSSVLSTVLSVETTANADGRFVLSGLTPGTYIVQAALDDIWLSPPTELDVPNPASKQELPLIQIAIPAPGAEVRLRLLDPEGKPVVGRTATLDRSGPLAGLWPREFMTDGAGSIDVPTLESGRHKIHVDGVKKTVEFDVPLLPAAAVVLTLHETR